MSTRQSHQQNELRCALTAARVTMSKLQRRIWLMNEVDPAWLLVGGSWSEREELAATKSQKAAISGQIRPTQGFVGGCFVMRSYFFKQIPTRKLVTATIVNSLRLNRVGNTFEGLWVVQAKISEMEVKRVSVQGMLKKRLTWSDFYQKRFYLCLKAQFRQRATSKSK